MMPVAIYLPLLFALGLLAVVALSTVSSRIDRVVTSLSLKVFHGTVEEHGRSRQKRKRLLHAVHSVTTYPAYATKTISFAIAAGVATSIVGLYLAYAVLSILITYRETVRAVLPDQIHFVIAEGPLDGPAEGADGGGFEITFGIVDLIGALVPRIIREGVVVLLSLLPEAVQPSPPEGMNVEILIVLPRPDFLPDSLAALSLTQLGLLVVVGLAFGVLVAGTVYYWRWHHVRNAAEKRGEQIDLTLAHTISFIYALSRSGMVYPEVMRIVGQNRKAFGESAEEVGVVVKDMDLYGTDLITALYRVSRRTPSEHFADFADNFANVLQSGRNVPQFLRSQYDQYQHERRANQEHLLESFAAFGEGYVAVLVAGPLFLVTILTIIGMLTGGLFTITQLIVYVGLPLANVGFIYYLSSVGQPLATYHVPVQKAAERRPLTVRRVSDSEARAEPIADGRGPPVDGGQYLRRLEAYNRVRPLKRALKDPLKTLTLRPELLLYVSVPLAVVALLARVSTGSPGGITIRALDDWLIQTILIVVGTFALVEEIHTRRLRNIEDALPDFLESLASTNEAGMTFTESLERTDKSDLGVLNEELERLLADIKWGARTEQALYRFNERVNSSTVARSVVLITNAMKASNHLGPVIRIAADEAREIRRLKRELRQETSMYVVLIYISFLVFLGIVLMLKIVLVPTIPSAEQMTGVSGLKIAITPIEQEMKGRYMLILFHTAVVQALVSGFVAGQMSEMSVRRGAKHVTIMLAIAYGTFLIFG